MKLLKKFFNSKKFSYYQFKYDKGVSAKYTDSYFDTVTKEFYS